MNRYLSMVLVLPVLAPQTLNGQSARVMPWIPLIVSPKNEVAIHCRWVFQDHRVWLEFSNKGLKPVHFNYYFPWIEQKDAASRNPRLHLDPDKSVSGPTIVKIPLAGHLAISSIPELVDVRLGDQDEGSFWNWRD